MEWIDCDRINKRKRNANFDCVYVCCASFFQQSLCYEVTLGRQLQIPKLKSNNHTETRRSGVDSAAPAPVSSRSFPCLLSITRNSALFLLQSAAASDMGRIGHCKCPGQILDCIHEGTMMLQMFINKLDSPLEVMAYNSLNLLFVPSGSSFLMSRRI